jgi:hypothetical protein
MIAIGNSKGGVGKTTAAMTIAAIFNPAKKIKLIELDSFNQSAGLAANSEIVEVTTFIAFGETLDDAMDEAIIADTKEDTVVVFDGGAGFDSKNTLAKVGDEFGGELEYWIPAMPDPETIRNVDEILKTIPKKAKKVLILSNFINVTYDYWFICGSEKYGFEPDFSIIEKFDDVIEFPRTNLVAIMKAYRTTMSDIAKFSQQYDYAEQRKKWATELSRDEMKVMMKRHRLSADCNKFIELVRESRVPAKRWIENIKAKMADNDE